MIKRSTDVGKMDLSKAIIFSNFNFPCCVRGFVGNSYDDGAAHKYFTHAANGTEHAARSGWRPQELRSLEYVSWLTSSDMTLLNSADLNSD